MGNNAEVLIVEDDPMVAELNRRYISRVAGFVCADVVYQVKDALTVLKKKPIDLLLLDVYLPDINGLEFLSQVRQKHVNVDVIVVTAARDVENIEEALRLGAVDYLIKPFEFERLAGALSLYASRKTVHRAAKIDQDVIDRYVFHREQVHQEYPKGVDKNTLNKVKIGIGQLSALQEFDADDVAHIVGISRVTARRYLESMVDSGDLSKDLRYGTVGRPIAQFKMTEKFHVE